MPLKLNNHKFVNVILIIKIIIVSATVEINAQRTNNNNNNNCKVVGYQTADGLTREACVFVKGVGDILNKMQEIPKQIMNISETVNNNIRNMELFPQAGSNTQYYPKQNKTSRKNTTTVSRNNVTVNNFEVKFPKESPLGVLGLGEEKLARGNSNQTHFTKNVNKSDESVYRRINESHILIIPNRDNSKKSSSTISGTRTNNNNNNNNTTVNRSFLYNNEDGKSEAAGRNSSVPVVHTFFNNSTERSTVSAKENMYMNTNNITFPQRNAFDFPERCPDGKIKDLNGICVDEYV